MGDNDDQRGPSLRLPTFWPENTEAWLPLWRRDSGSSMSLMSLRSSTISWILFPGSPCARCWIWLRTRRRSALHCPQGAPLCGSPANGFPACGEAFPDGLAGWTQAVWSSFWDARALPDGSRGQSFLPLPLPSEVAQGASNHAGWGRPSGPSCYCC